MNTNNTSNADIANGNASAEAIRDLDTLNRLFRKYETAAKKLTEAYNRAFADMDDRVCGFRKAAQEASEKFDEFRKRMAKVKEDGGLKTYPGGVMIQMF